MTLTAPCYASVFTLVSLLRDGQKGFLQMSEHLHEPGCKALLIEQGCLRASYADEIEQLCAGSGSEKEHQTGTTFGAVHRCWIELKASLGSDDSNMLHTLDWCEEVAVKAYETVLNDDDLPDLLRAPIERQARHVRHTHDSVLRLCGANPAQ